MKKITAVMALAMTIGVSGVTAFAAPVYRNATPQQVEFDEATAVENYIEAQEARKVYLKDLYDRELITKSRYDLSIANIQANIDYVQENGLGMPDSGYGYGGCGGFGCGGW